MKVLFQVGTPLSAENLNLLSSASNDAGVLKGCDVYLDGNYLSVSNGFVQFKDGILVYLNDNEKISLSNLPHNNYYVYVVRYGNDFTLDINVLLPSDYEYVLLATITLGNTIKIDNVKKSTEINNEKIIECSTLNPNSILSNNVNTTIVKDYVNYYVYLNARVDYGNSGYIAIPFTYPNFDINKIKLKAELPNEVSLKLSILKNGNSIYSDKELTFNDFSNNEYEFTLPDMDVENGDLCALQLTLTNNGTEIKDVKMYSILMQT